MSQPKKVVGTLILEDGTRFQGFSFGAEKHIAGEVVFNTGMVGYPESLTDPSYRGQILCLTYPLVGNYGVPPEERDEYGLLRFFESDQIQITALLIANYSEEHSHWNSGCSLADWLKDNGIPALHGIDTRQLTKKLREKGSMLGKIVFSPEAEQTTKFVDPNQTNLVAQASRKEVQVFESHCPKPANGRRPRVVVIDCGIKNNIIRYLLEKNVELVVVPWDHDIRKEEYDGLFISNGPGDPILAWKTVKNLQWAINQDKPVFGICMGNQLLSLAAGANTYKMKFGNRGMNQPCVNLFNHQCYITPQNHGYAIEADTLPEEWEPFFVNANDGTNEGIIHKTKPVFSVQFHPEAKGGPNDTEYLFDFFLDLVKERMETGTNRPMNEVLTHQEKEDTRVHVEKVLILGSGGLSIGQAGEFDYSGSQAIKALREENIHTILINPNIATIQTSKGLADKVYFLPVTPEFVTEIIRKERPDSILLTFGGQTALNCGIKLWENNVFQEYGVRVLGTPIDTIVATEDRELFASKLDEINVNTLKSIAASSVDEALEAGKEIGYPVIVRAAFALGGLGSGFADNPETLRDLASKAFTYTSQILVEKSIKGWKEVEYEVVRDCKNNCITVCNMENFDPLGIHTGDSIVVAPSQTLSNEEYFKLRSLAIKTVRHLGVVGECNIQYALDPYSEQYYVIEVNARLSRSSALASKATGYPLAFVAAKLALGVQLPDIKNSVTKCTTACFEPSLDYVVVKFPRWDLSKFTNVSRKIGSSMKSVGEAMAIGRSFEEALQKAIRMVSSVDGFRSSAADHHIEEELASPSEERIFALASAFHQGYTVDQVYELSKIDRWFLYKCAKIVEIEQHLKNHTDATVPMDLMLDAKKAGFSDAQIARVVRGSEDNVRKHRKSQNVVPCVKQIDTLAAEYPANTNYLYMTYHGTENDIHFNDHGIMVLGSGTYRIGSSVEFDWCAVSCVRTLRKLGYKTIMVNFNPETVSTDYDECDRLYFDEITLERVLDIYDIEASEGVVVSVGGQTPNNIAVKLHQRDVKILGTSPDQIDRAENRFKFSQLLDSINVDQPEWNELTTYDEAKKFCDKVGFPVLVRPSYVLSGAAMNVAQSHEDLRSFLNEAADVSPEHPVVVSKFITEAKEIEMDAVAKNGEVLVYAISEHVENAGVHSGDATLVLPAQNLYVETMRRVKAITKKIARSLAISGPFNIQYLAKHNDIKVIECNLRSSRTFPFVSKVFNVDFIEIATKVMLDIPVRPVMKNIFDLDYVAIKAPQFSFTRLNGADPTLGVEMASTGEVACFGDDKYEAFLKALVATGFRIPAPGSSILLSLGALKPKVMFLPYTRELHSMGYKLCGTEGTAQFLIENGVPCETLFWDKQDGENTRCIEDVLMNRGVDLLINVPTTSSKSSVSRGYGLRRNAVDMSISLISNIKCAMLLVDSLQRAQGFEKKITAWQEHLGF